MQWHDNIIVTSGVFTWCFQKLDVDAAKIDEGHCRFSIHLQAVCKGNRTTHTALVYAGNDLEHTPQVQRCNPKTDFFGR